MPRHPTLGLTDQQQRVLEMIAQHRTNPEIAAELGISLDGATYHVREVFGKLGVESREEAIAAWRAGQPTLLERIRGFLWPAVAIVATGSAAAAVVVGLMVAGSRAGNPPKAATSSPATGNDRSIETAEQRLSDANPQWTTFIDAVQTANVAAMLGYFRWQDHACIPASFRIADATSCSTLGVTDGTVEQMFPVTDVPLPTGPVDPQQGAENVGWHVHSEVAATFAALLRGRHPTLVLVAAGSDGRMYLTFGLDAKPDSTGFIVRGISFQVQSARSPVVNIYSEVGSQATPLSSIDGSERSGSGQFDIWGVAPELQAEEAAIQRSRHGP